MCGQGKWRAWLYYGANRTFPDTASLCEVEGMITLLALLPFLLPPQDAPPPHSVTELSEGVFTGAREGRVTLECVIRPDGGLRDCRVISESPRGAGFGRAALDAASRTRRSVLGAGGGGRVRWTQRYVVPAEPSPPVHPTDPPNP